MVKPPVTIAITLPILFMTTSFFFIFIRERWLEYRAWDIKKQISYPLSQVVGEEKVSEDNHSHKAKTKDNADYSPRFLMNHLV